MLATRRQASRSHDQAAVHAPCPMVIETDADAQALEQYATRGQETGGKWADALKDHTLGKANWTYPHRASCHFYVETIVCGPQRPSDDSILETSNRPKKALKRLIYSGGTNEKGAVVSQRRFKAEYDDSGKPTGELIEYEVVQPAQLGQAAQAQRLQKLAELTRAQREGLQRSRDRIISARRQKTLDVKQEERHQAYHEAASTSRALVKVFDKSVSSPP